MKSYKFLVHVNTTCIQVASITDTSDGFGVMDNEHGHFSFAIFSQDPEDVLAAFEQIIEERQDPDNYYNTQEYVLRSSQWSDTIRFVRHCNTLSITRGNLKVLYNASVDRLLGLPAALRKAVDKYNKQYEKELEKDLQE